MNWLTESNEYATGVLVKSGKRNNYFILFVKIIIF